MDTWLTVIRFLHIFAAIFWVGTTLFMAMFLEPTVRAMGPAGGQFMQRLTSDTRFSLAISLSALVTVFAGLILYGPVTNNNMEVMFGNRLPLTIGAIAGIASALMGGLVSGRTSSKITALGAEMAAQKGKPKPEQLSQMTALQDRMRMSTRVTALLMVIAVVGMTW